MGYFGDDLEQTLDEKQSFKNFIVAFEGLLGMNILSQFNFQIDQQNATLLLSPR